MHRKPRIHYPGALYHVMLRGHSGEPVFFDGSDRCRFYLLLPEGAGRYGWVFDLCAESGRSALGNAGSGQFRVGGTLWCVATVGFESLDVEPDPCG